MENKFGFVNEKFIFPSAIEAGSDGNIVEFYLNPETSKGDIEEVKVGCGCTADIKILDDRIQATYTDSTPSSSFEGKSTSHHIPIEKNMTVFYKDGKPLKITDAGKKKFNMQKAHTILRFFGNVKQA
jgi:hypothetical protein